MGRGDRAGQPVRQRQVDRLGIGQAIERLGLVEPAHRDRPFDDLAVARQRQCAVRLPCDRDHAKINLRREPAVDLKLGLACRFAQRQRGEIQKRIADGTLDLEGAVAGQEHHRRVGIDTPHRRAAVSLRIGQEREDIALAGVPPFRMAGAIVMRGQWCWPSVHS